MRVTRQHRLWLVAVLAVAAAARLAGLESVPPGVNHDEASNGYDAYSILKTGQDRWGHAWPVLLEAFGRADWRGALYAYLIVPFHALVGPEHLILSTRLPAALAGILTVAGLYVLVARVCGRSTALWAAFFLAICPWHMQLSRFGHESALTPACTVLGLMFMALAGWPFRRRTGRPIRLNPVLLACAAVVLALSLYTYASMRLFTPLLVVVVLWASRRGLADACRTASNREAIWTAAFATAVVLAPLAYLTAADWEHVMARARQVSVFAHAQGVADALTVAARQYAAHFGPSFLVVHGDPYIIQSPRGFGQLNVCLVPLLLSGIYRTLRGWRRRPVYLVLLGWLAIYPLAAALSQGGPHALRSACGLPVFQWIAAIGCRSLIRTFRTVPARRRLAAVACSAAMLCNAMFFARAYFVDWARDPRVVAMYQQDLCDAVKAIRPMVGKYDTVFISDQRDFARQWHSAEAYIVVLLVLPVAPRDFHDWSKSVFYERPSDGFHRVASFGPFVMTTLPEVLDRSLQSEPGHGALIITRPGQIRGGTLLRTITAADGTPRFEIISVRH